MPLLHTLCADSPGKLPHALPYRAGEWAAPGTRGLLPAAEQQGLDAQPVGIQPETHDRAHGHGSQERDVAELLSREDRRDVHLDDRHRHRRHRIAQRHRRMGISAGIEHHTCLLYTSDAADE
mgnify:CR=1 FL=1